MNYEWPSLVSNKDIQEVIRVQYPSMIETTIYAVIFQMAMEELPLEFQKGRTRPLVQITRSLRAIDRFAADMSPFKK